MIVRKLFMVAGLALAAQPAMAEPLPKPPSFATCSVCHKVQAGVPSAMGPNLWGVGGRQPATLPGYTYSPAMKKVTKPWTRATLIAFITEPQKTAPGNKMAYAGQKDPKVAAALADYLLSLK